jgi:hypothetical protein
MSQNKRILIAVLILVILAGGVLLIDLLRRQGTTSEGLEPGEVPIYLDGELVDGFNPEDLDRLEKVSFVDPVEGKTQEGWLLRDVLALYVAPDDLDPDTRVTVSSSSREKSAVLIWAEVENTDNMVMFDLSNRGTLKLVSKMEKLDTRDEWVQDADKIELDGAP